MQRNPDRDRYIDRLGWFLISAIAAYDEATEATIKRKIRSLDKADIEFLSSRLPYYSECYERAQLDAIMKPRLFG